MRGFLLLIQKNSVTHMYGLAVYVKEGLPHARDLSLEIPEGSYLFAFSMNFTSVSASLLFSLLIT